MSASTTDPLFGNPRWEKLRDLSRGSSGFVQLARNRVSGELAAIKVIDRGDHLNKHVEAEILNHHMLRHPHVIELKEVFLTQRHICIVMEYATGGSLFEYVQRTKRLREPVARWFFQQLIIGLDYCHQKGVVNRDIKLENTLLLSAPGMPQPLLKICDFGYSKAHLMSAPKTKVGTLTYMAPEVIKTTDRYDGKQADIWSCGVMLYIVLFKRYPFESPAESILPTQQRVQLIMSRILRNEWSIPPGVQISPECQDLLMGLLVDVPHQRLTIQQVMAHPWFAQNLPPEYLTNIHQMNQDFLHHADFTGIQSLEEIQAIVKQAQNPKPGIMDQPEYCGGVQGNMDDEMGDSNASSTIS